MIIASARRGLPVALAAVAGIAGMLVAIHYHRLGLTLSHYDARGHLVVARRIIDSITPGWQQIGAVWLPLPHLLNALPVQVDAWYRSGASAVAISIASFALAVGAIAWIVLRLTASPAAAVAGAAVFALNPNVLYLQATPMTEPLLLGLTTLSVAMLMNWTAGLKTCATPVGLARDFNSAVTSGVAQDFSPAVSSGVAQDFSPAVSSGVAQDFSPAVSSGVAQDFSPAVSSGVAQDFFSPAVSPVVVGSVFALACLTRYEAWPVTFAALAAAVWTRWRHGDSLAVAAGRVAAIALVPIAAIAGFLIFSRVVIGQWFVSSGFFTPENKALGDPVMSAAELWYGLHALSGSLLVAMAAAGAAALLILGIARTGWAHGLIALSLAATASLPWLAFVEGHPFRIRYMVPLIAIEAIGAGVTVGFVGRAFLQVMTSQGAPARHDGRHYSASAAGSSIVATGLLLAFALRPLDLTSPMVVEAQWDRPNVPVRRQVTACLGDPQPGEKIMASMGSLGHYMQEASAAGFSLRDFLHEGNGDIWLAALASGPRPFADWVLIEEKAEGGDMLAKLARAHPDFLDGYVRTCEGAGLALYKRKSATTG